MKVYYNENDPYPARWLVNLIEAGLLPDGDVDTRSIQDVQPEDLKGYAQCHFFAGIGIWPLALKNLNVDTSLPIWTGSCPCQPFSSAGNRKGKDDERHLAPELTRLIEACEPAIVFGEQVEGKAGFAWLDDLFDDLENKNYRTAAASLCAAGAGSPHVRQRLYWVAYATHKRPLRWQAEAEYEDEIKRGNGRVVDLIEYTQDRGADSNKGTLPTNGFWKEADSLRDSGADSNKGTLPTNGFWKDADWLRCWDGKWRPVEPGTFPMADGTSSRVGKIRAYGNAIVPQLAEIFVESCLEFLSEEL